LEYKRNDGQDNEQKRKRDKEEGENMTKNYKLLV